MKNLRASVVSGEKHSCSRCGTKSTDAPQIVISIGDHEVSPVVADYLKRHDPVAAKDIVLPDQILGPLCDDCWRDMMEAAKNTMRRLGSVIAAARGKGR